LILKRLARRVDVTGIPMQKLTVALIKLAVVMVLFVWVCFAFPVIVVRVLGILASIFLALNAYCFFEHAVLYRDKWETATTGKRRTPPGQSVIAGSIFLALAVALIVFCFWIVP
jgi:hypothetical protein